MGSERSEFVIFCHVPSSHVKVIIYFFGFLIVLVYNIVLEFDVCFQMLEITTTRPNCF